jgi:uncharacterized membrane protein
MSAKFEQRASMKSITPDQTNDKQAGLCAILARPFWMFFGNFVLLISAAYIFMGENKQSHISDIFFWGSFIALIVVRFLDIKFLNGQTAEGKPATIKHWRNYTILLGTISVVIWSAAHLAAYLLKS